MTDSPVIRPARKADACEMLVLVDSAGYGVPLWIWTKLRKDESSVLEVGRQRAMREQSAFSYRNAHMVELGGAIAGMMVSYRLDDPYVMPDPSTVPTEFQPAFELESLVPGSWNVNVIAVHPEYRGRGLGALLLTHAERLAGDAGAQLMSIIFENRNLAAMRVYQRSGYAEMARRGRVPFPGDYTGSEEWVLMTKNLH